MPPNAFAQAANISNQAPDLIGIDDANDPSAQLEKIGSAIENMSPEERSDVALSIPAMSAMRADDAKGIDARSQFYQLLKKDNNALNAKRSELIQKMASDSPLSKSETAAMLFIGLLPTLVGKAVGGNRGGQIGAQAGALGTQVMTAGIKADENKRDARNRLEVEAIDKQLTKNEDLLGKAKLDEFNAADTAIQKNADREQSAINAEIRAGGEVNAAKETAAALNNQTKQARLDKLDSERQARAKPIRVNGVDYVSSGSATDADVKDVRDSLTAYKTFDKLMQQMINEARGHDATFFSNQIGDSSTKLGALKEAGLKELAKIEEIPGRGGEYQIESLKKLLQDPTTLTNNIFSRTPLKASIENQLKITKEIINTKLDIYLQSKGMDQKIPIGKRFPAPDGKLGWYIGMKDGNPIITTDEQKYLDIKELE